MPTLRVVRVVKNGSQTFLRVSSSMPQPLSETVSESRCSFVSSLTSIVISDAPAEMGVLGYIENVE